MSREWCNQSWALKSALSGSRVLVNWRWWRLVAQDKLAGERQRRGWPAAVAIQMESMGQMPRNPGSLWMWQGSSTKEEQVRALSLREEKQGGRPDWTVEGWILLSHVNCEELVAYPAWDTQLEGADSGVRDKTGEDEFCCPAGLGSNPSSTSRVSNYCDLGQLRSLSLSYSICKMLI